MIGGATAPSSSSIDQDWKKTRRYTLAAFILTFLFVSAFVAGQYSSDNSNNNYLMGGSASMTVPHEASVAALELSSDDGLCQTTGNYNDVVEFHDQRHVIPGKIYHGLDFRKKHSWKGVVGKCTVISVWLPAGTCTKPLTHITEAWQKCAKHCNDNKSCKTFSVHLHNWSDDKGDYNDYKCFLHDDYDCSDDVHYPMLSNIENTCAGENDCYVWSGICRPKKEGSTYACY